MNRCLLYILLVATVPVTLHSAQINNASIETEITLHDKCVYFYGSGNKYPKEVLTRKQLDARCNKLLQNRPLLEASDSPGAQEPFLQQNYIWEKIGKPNHPNEYLHTKHKDGCNRWHQIHVDSVSIEQSSHNIPDNIPTVEQLKITKRNLYNLSKQLRQQQQQALAAQQALLAEETLRIVRPVAAIAQINKSEKLHEIYLQNSQKRYADLKTTSQNLRKQIPLDIQEYLKKNPETWNSLKLLANIEEQEAQLVQENMREHETYALAQKDKDLAKDQLQTAWLKFDQAATSNTTLAQYAYKEKRKRIMNAQPNNPVNVTTIEMTNEEIADYICTYKVKTVLSNVISKEEQDILASTYPTAIPPCIQGSHAQQLFLQDPALGLIEAAKKILLQKALQAKRDKYRDQDPAIITTSINLTQDEINECLRIWSISEVLKKIATEKQLQDITKRFPHYTLKIIAEQSIKPQSQELTDSENIDDQEVSAVENERDLSLHSSYDPTPSTGSSSWGIGSFISW